MKRIIIILLTAILPIVCFGQNPIVRKVIVQGTKTVVKNGAERKARNLTVKEATIALKNAKKANNPAEVKAAIKALDKAQNAAKNALLSPSNAVALLEGLKITEKEAQIIAIELKPFYSRISLNSKVISQALSYCQKSGIKSSKGFHEMLDEIDRYSHVINQEFNTLKRLDKSGKLTTQQLIRLYDLKLMFKEKEAVLTGKAVEDLIGSISQTAYTESSKLPLKGFVHILLRHTIQSTTKSSFTIPRSNVFEEIIKTISDEKNFVALKDGTLKTYVKKFSTPIGVDKKGNDVYHLVVWVDKKNKKVISAFPVPKAYVDRISRATAIQQAA